MHFDATLNVLRFSLPHLPTSRLDSNSQTNAPRLDFLPLQHLQLEKPRSSFLSKRLKSFCPAFQKCHPQGLATLSTVSAFPSLGNVCFQHSWDSLFRVLFLSDGQRKFPFLFPLLRFFPRPSGFGPVLQRLHPIEEAVPLFATSKSFEAGSTTLLRFLTFQVFS